MSEKFIANRNLYHTFSRIAIQEGQGVAAAVNKTGHTVTTNDIWTDVDKLPKNTTYFGNANTAFDDLKAVYGANSAEFSKYVKLYENAILSPVDGSGQDADKNQAWQLLVDGKRVTNFVAPTDVFDNDGKPCNGYTLQLFDKEGIQIAATDGNWAFDYLAGLVIFERGKTPQDMGWAGTDKSAYIKITAWGYVGSFLNTKLEDLDTKLEDLDDTIASSDNFGSHTIVLDKLDKAADGYASSYQLLVDGAQQGDIINIPKDQFLKGADIVEGIYDEAKGEFTASNDITDEQLKKDIKKYIHFTFEIKVKDADTLAVTETSQEKHIYLDIQELCDIYTGGNGITIDANNIIAAKVDGETIVFTESGALKAVIPEVPVKSVSGGVGITETSTTGDVVLNLNAAKSDEIGGVKSGGDISVAADGTVSVLSARFADVAGKVENALTAFGTNYDGSEAVTISGKVVEGENYITYSQVSGVFTLSSTNLDVVSGYYVKATNVVSGNLEALDTNLKTVSGDLDELEAKVGKLSGGNYIAGDIVASDLKALDTQVKANAEDIKTNAEAIATNAEAIANLIKDCVIKITSDSVTMADEALSALLVSAEVVSGVVTIVFNKEVLEIGQREAAKGVTLSGKFEDVYPDEEFDTETKVTTLSAGFGNYLDNKDVQWRITYRG